MIQAVRGVNRKYRCRFTNMSMEFEKAIQLNRSRHSLAYFIMAGSKRTAKAQVSKSGLVGAQEVTHATC